MPLSESHERTAGIGRALLDELCGRGAARHGDDAWRRMAAEADRRDAIPLLHAALRSSGRLSLVPADVRGALEQGYGMSALRGGLLHADLRAVLQALREAGVPVIVLKGAFLAEAVYGDIALRPMGDLDLLLQERDLDAAVRALSALGYAQRPMSPATSDHHLPPMVHSRRTPVELHRRIKEWRDPAGLWERACPATVAGEAVQRLSATDLILQLALHAGEHHRWQGVGHSALPLRALFDIALSVAHYEREIDWTLLASIANGAGAGAHAYVAFAIARSLAAAPVPAEALEALRPDSETLRMVVRVEQLLTTSTEDIPSVYGSWRSADAVGPRMAVVLRAIFPSLDRLRAMYGLSPQARIAPLYYLLRPFDLLRRRTGVIARLATGLRGGNALVARERVRGEIEHFGSEPQSRHSR